MFAKLLIANRGEIACRIIRTARAMGIATVAVHSDADARAPHVALADEALRIGSAPAAASYLDIDAIVEAARRSGAGAVHPGYGFLAENAAFARALAAAGIAFVGPHPRALEQMGDKIAARALARAAGAPVIAGSDAAIADLAEAGAVAAAIGYPVMVKAAAGGGGKGLRLVRAAAGLADALQRARAEAMSAFGDDRVLIEKAIAAPRHIEVQVLGDRHGGLIHLGERECSIQRRAQKLIEEAPAPRLDSAARAALADHALAVARAVAYDSAGTVEFIAHRDGRFYFLEMNARLQVEHGVTELVTGVDIVAAMIRSAAGEPLALRQDDIGWRGAAIESRICAEDPRRGFVPSAGRLTLFRPPPEGMIGAARVRIDSGVVEGSDVPVHYDSLIAKLITHAGDRAGAIAAQALALDGFAIAGVETNISFLAAVMNHQRWRHGDVTTGFIAEEFPDGFAAAVPEGELALRLAAIMAAIDQRLRDRRRSGAGRVERAVMLGPKRYDVCVEPGDGAAAVRFRPAGPTRLCASGWRPGEPVWRGGVDGEPCAVRVRPILNGFRLACGSVEVDAHVYPRRVADLAALMPRPAPPDASTALLCPMPALLKAVHVAPGDRVEAGQTLCVIEAMKMETALAAERDGRVETVLAQAGDYLAIDAPILRLA